MNLLIDGHNLIGRRIFHDIRLSDEDDEAKLVMRLKVWQSRVHKVSKGSMTVIFDRGMPGGRNVRMGGGGVHVIFAADPMEADDLIRRRLRRATPGLILVSNDEALLHDASMYGVKSWRGEEFVERMTLKGPIAPEAGTEEEVRVSKAEVAEWLAIFRARSEARKAARKRASAQGGEKPERKAPAKTSAKKSTKESTKKTAKPSITWSSTPSPQAAKKSGQKPFKKKGKGSGKKRR